MRTAKAFHDLLPLTGMGVSPRATAVRSAPPKVTRRPCPPPVIVTDVATTQSFNAERYLLLNPDVAARVGAEGDARRHFEKHGAREGRRQITREFLSGRLDRDRRKFERFSGLLDPAAGAGGAFRFVGAAGSLPVYYGGKPYAAQTYEAESANPGLGEFVRELEANPNKNYLDLGCGFRSLIFENCLYLEVYPR